MTMRHVLNISPEIQSGLPHNMPGHGMSYPSKYMQNGYDFLRPLGRPYRSLSLQNICERFMILCDLLAGHADPCETCGLFHSLLNCMLPLLHARLALRIHASSSSFACAMVLNRDISICHRLINLPLSNQDWENSLGEKKKEQSTPQEPEVDLHFLMDKLSSQESDSLSTT